MHADTRARIREKPRTFNESPPKNPRFFRGTPVKVYVSRGRGKGEGRGDLFELIGILYGSRDVIPGRGTVAPPTGGRRPMGALGGATAHSANRGPLLAILSIASNERGAQR